MRRKKETLGGYILYCEAKTESQKIAIESCFNNDITFLIGPAGGGKSFIAVYAALREMFEHNDGERRQVNKIIITRPAVTAGEELGHLPGELDQKLFYYLQPIYDCIGKFVKDKDKFIKENIQLLPFAFMRGANIEHSIAILDEAQNCTQAQLLLFLTRLSTGGKLIITGDPSQTDIGAASGLMPVVHALRGEPGIAVVNFQDTEIVRHPLVSRIIKKLSGT